MNELKALIVLSTIACLGGCASAQPNFNYGHYYMTGDSECAYTQQRTENTIHCYNSDKEPTGYRVAMTDQQMSMYMHKQSMTQQANDAQAQRNSEQQTRNAEQLKSMGY